MRKVIVGTAVAALALSLTACGNETETASPDTTSVVESGYGIVTIDGDPLPQLEDPTNDPAVGMPAPAISGLGPDGSAVELTPGQAPILAVMVAHWCPHCQTEIPELVDWLAANDTDVEVFVLATGTDPQRPNFPPGDWLLGEDVEAPIILDDEAGSIATAYGLPGWPYWVAIGADGTVAFRFSGEVPPDSLDAVFAAVPRS